MATVPVNLDYFSFFKKDKWNKSNVVVMTRYGEQSNKNRVVISTQQPSHVHWCHS